jgi:hypothetical protein
MAVETTCASTRTTDPPQFHATPPSALLASEGRSSLRLLRTRLPLSACVSLPPIRDPAAPWILRQSAPKVATLPDVVTGLDRGAIGTQNSSEARQLSGPVGGAAGVRRGRAFRLLRSRRPDQTKIAAGASTRTGDYLACASDFCSDTSASFSIRSVRTLVFGAASSSRAIRCSGLLVGTL